VTVCGYNARMGEGLRILFEGMYEAVAAKSRDERIPFADVLRRELVEIPRINAALQFAREGSFVMFRGLNIMALAHFQEVLAKSKVDPSDKTAFMSEVERFITILEEVEDYNLSIPPAAPRTDQNIARRADSVGKWIVERYIAEKV
jgi:hypothetical protein